MVKEGGGGRDCLGAGAALVVGVVGVRLVVVVMAAVLGCCCCCLVLVVVLILVGMTPKAGIWLSWGCRGGLGLPVCKGGDGGGVSNVRLLGLLSCWVMWKRKGKGEWKEHRSMSFGDFPRFN